MQSEHSTPELHPLCYGYAFLRSKYCEKYCYNIIIWIIVHIHSDLGSNIFRSYLRICALETFVNIVSVVSLLLFFVLFIFSEIGLRVSLFKGAVPALVHHSEFFRVGL